MAEIVRRDGEYVVPFIEADGSKDSFVLRYLIQRIIAEELGYNVTDTLAQRLSHLRNDGGASS